MTSTELILDQRSTQLRADSSAPELRTIKRFDRAYAEAICANVTPEASIVSALAGICFRAARNGSRIAMCEGDRNELRVSQSHFCLRLKNFTPITRQFTQATVIGGVLQLASELFSSVTPATCGALVACASASSEVVRAARQCQGITLVELGNDEPNALGDLAGALGINLCDVYSADRALKPIIERSCSIANSALHVLSPSQTLETRARLAAEKLLHAVDDDEAARAAERFISLGNALIVQFERSPVSVVRMQELKRVLRELDVAAKHSVSCAS